MNKSLYSRDWNLFSKPGASSARLEGRKNKQWEMNGEQMKKGPWHLAKEFEIYLEKGNKRRANVEN